MAMINDIACLKSSITGRHFHPQIYLHPISIELFIYDTFNWHDGEKANRMKSLTMTKREIFI